MRLVYVGVIVALASAACTAESEGGETLDTGAATRSGNLAFGDVNVSLVTEVPNNSFTEDVVGRIDLGCDKC